MKTNDQIPSFIQALVQIVGPENALTSAEDCVAYGTDWTRFPGKAMVVLRPKTTEEVAKILKACHAEKVSVVPSGGRTGLAAGASTQPHQIALNLGRINAIGPVDPAGRTVRVQAGAITQSVHEHCETHGLTWPIDLAAKGSSTIGGNLSTNAGGVRVVRYGMARKWVCALQAVLVDGTVIELNHGLEKNNTGYDLLQLIVGSEGTLAVITEATLKLAKLPKSVAACLLAVSDLNRALALFESARGEPFEVLACEFFSDLCREAVETKLKRKARLKSKSPFYLLIEVDDGAFLNDWLSKQMEQNAIADGMVGKTSQERAELWSVREGITESLALIGTVRKYDVAVPVSRVVQFLEETEKLFSKMKLPVDLYLFGHLGDGSPHLNLVQQKDVAAKTFIEAADRFEKELYPLVKSYSGSLSAEHGIGILKKPWILYSRSPAEITLYQAIKRAFDPHNLLNPGKLIDLK